MDIKEINRFVESEIKRIREYYKDKNEEELTLAMIVKTVEEIGELFNEILAHKGFQRKSKLDKMDGKNLETELADSLITLFIIGRRFNIDIEKALKEKMEKIKQRDYNK